MEKRRSLYLLGVGAVFCALIFEAKAQTLNFASTENNQPIEITAEQGIEWQRDKLIFLAKGNAHAIRGDVNVYADTLKAHYREKAGIDPKTQANSKGTEIWRLDADSNVRIVSPGQKAFGDKGVYDVDKAILVLTSAGKKRVRFVTEQDIITSDRQIEYWEAKQMAVARGDAIAKREDRVLKADVLAAYFRKDKDGKSKVYRIEAFDNVRVNTAEERAIADRGVYVVATGIAVLTGRVRMFRGPDQLNGCKAEINLNTGISKLFSCPPSAEGGGRVHGVLKSSKGKKPVPAGKEK
ncbi:MAG: LptA/OstA family protein [Rhodospirillales bacterium]